ncbi:LPS-assembly protein LptD [Pelodictyon luteolum]|uniref:LPS-assembly protein LptD n=1 Tax=Pelodictyon luteolum TaxID=1100 RepID=UPI000ABB1867|nr:putative LPS assembly protein LptD [Pelodictyon luteolum]
MKLFDRQITGPLRRLLLLVCLSIPAFAVHAEVSAEQDSSSSRYDFVFPEEKSDSLVSASDSPGTPSRPVNYAARDSMVYHLDTKMVELWGKGSVTDEGTTIKGSKILINRNSSTLTAFGQFDSEHVLEEPATFSDAGGGFEGEAITYNFDTQKGKTFKASSVAQNIIFSGNDVTRLPDGELSIKGGSFTTCDDEDPHYWFSASRMHVVPDSRLHAWPLVMYVRPEIFSYRLPAIPILPLPYMVFPISSGRKSGLLIPRPGEDGGGFMLSGVGYYWAMNDYMDLRLEGDLHANSDSRTAERFRYVKYGDYSGSITGEQKTEGLSKNWYYNMVHSQVVDPTTSLGLNFQFYGGERESDLNSIDSESIITEQSSASAYIAKTFDDNNSIASLGYSRSEDLRNSSSSQRISALFFQNRLYPYLDAEPGDWRRDVSLSSGVSYIGDFSKSTSGSSSDGYALNANTEAGYFHRYSDNFSALYTQGVSVQSIVPDTTRYPHAFSGSRLVMPFQMQSTINRHFHLNPSLTFNHYEPDEGQGDPFSSMVFTLDGTTRLYGRPIGTGFLENLTGMTAVRHVFIPALTYAWNPEYSGSDFYDSAYDWADPLRYGRFESPIYTGVAAGQSTIGISLRNLIQGRFRGGEYPSPGAVDGGDYSRQLLSLTASTSYNFAADSLRLAPVTFLATSNAISDHLLLSTGGMYDYYSYNPETGERIDRSSSEDGHGLLRFVKGFVNMSLSFEGERKGTAPRSSVRDSGVPFVMNANQALFLERFNMGDFGDVDFGIPWQLRMSMFLYTDHDPNRSYAASSPSSMSLLNAMLRIGITRNWQVAVNSGYDFLNNDVVFPMVQVNRDLHCWQLSFQWVPSGVFKSYSIQIGLKAPQLRDIKFSKKGTSLSELSQGI